MKYIRLLLLPFSALYSLMIRLRHFCYDRQILSSREFDFPVICVGNLSLGGTGKSPMIEFLLRHLESDFQMATLSRGYKRKTTGFVELQSESTAADVGDEPLQFKTNFPQQIIAVDEDRVHGVERLRELHPHLKGVFLDDSFQHRKIKAGLNILLTTFDALYVDDFLLPAGNLRDSTAAANRADLVIVTKCPSELSEEHRIKVRKKLRLKQDQQLFFSQISYDQNIYSIETQMSLAELDDFVLVTGIAKPKSLVNYLKQLGKKFQHENFSDHHHFSEKEIQDLKSSGKKILSTTKDFMRLKPYFQDAEIFHLPITSDFYGKEKQVLKPIYDFMHSFSTSNQ
ncbi:MAG: tetraacyldisaccharide 4'-kinase [Flavobacteriaceae bacterium]